MLTSHFTKETSVGLTTSKSDSSAKTYLIWSRYGLKNILRYAPIHTRSFPCTNTPLSLWETKWMPEGLRTSISKRMNFWGWFNLVWMLWTLSPQFWSLPLSISFPKTVFLRLTTTIFLTLRCFRLSLRVFTILLKRWKISTKITYFKTIKFTWNKRFSVLAWPWSVVCT